MIAFGPPDHDWNEVLNDSQRVAYVCGKCGKQLPGLIVMARPDDAQQMREGGRLPRGAELIESPYVPDGTALAMDPRATELWCPA